MRKLLLTLLVATPALSFASLDMSQLGCRNLKINSSTTLQEVQNSCLIKKQAQKSGMYEVKFVNTVPVDKKGKPTNKTVTCMFATKDPTSVVNGCK